MKKQKALIATPFLQNFAWAQIKLNFHSLSRNSKFCTRRKKRNQRVFIFRGTFWVGWGRAALACGVINSPPLRILISAPKLPTEWIFDTNVATPLLPYLFIQPSLMWIFPDLHKTIYICAWIGKFAKFHSNSFRFESCFPWKLIQTAFDLETTTIWKSLPFERQSLFLLWFTTKGTFSKTNAKSLQSLSDLINLCATCWRKRRRKS